MSEPTISVIIPAFNAARYLAEALGSVRAQTLSPSEIIVVDNNSTDGTAAIAREAGVRCESELKRGAAAARNHGVAVASGDLLAFLDADDVWMPRKLEIQMAALKADARLEAVFGHLEQFISPDLPPEEALRIHCPSGAFPARLPSLMLIRRTAFERGGPFSTEVAVCEAVEWFARAQAAGLRIAVVPDLLVRRRLHTSNIGRSMRDQRLGYVRILKTKLDRERAASRQ